MIKRSAVIAQKYRAESGCRCDANQGPDISRVLHRIQKQCRVKLRDAIGGRLPSRGNGNDSVRMVGSYHFLQDLGTDQKLFGRTIHGSQIDQASLLPIRSVKNGLDGPLRCDRFLKGVGSLDEQGLEFLSVRGPVEKFCLVYQGMLQAVDLGGFAHDEFRDRIGDFLHSSSFKQRITAMSTTHSRATERNHWLEQQSEAMASDLEKLCNVNSGSENVAGLREVSRWLEEFFRPLQIPCTRTELAAYDTVDDAGKTVQKATGDVLRWDIDSDARTPRNAKVGSAQKRLLLSIHYDTVYEADSEFQRCQRLEGNRMRGPGVIDAKGGIVVLRYAVLALLKHSRDVQGVSIVLTPDEEIGSPSSMDYWKTIAADFDFAFLFEPSMADGSLVSTRKGTGTFVFVVDGKAAHSGRNFTAGRNAIVHASSMISQLHALNGLRPDVTVNVGRIQGGGAVNVVPDRTVFRVNARVASREDQVWVEEKFQAIVRNFNRPDEGFRVAVHGGILSPPKLLDPTIQDWMARIEEEGQTLGQPITWKASGGASDGNKLQSLGLPNIDTLGPDGDCLHSDQEWVDLTSLPRKAQLTAAMIDRWLRSREES